MGGKIGGKQKGSGVFNLIYDLRTNKHFTLKTDPLKREDLDEFVQCYNPENRYQRQPTWSDKNLDGRWRAYDYEELINRDKASLDIFWLGDESLEESDNLQLSGSMFNVQSSMLRGEEIVEDLEPPPSNNSARSQMT